MFLKVFIIFALFNTGMPIPLKEGTTGSRCFANGELVKTVNTTLIPSEVCVKDDISIIKSNGEHYKKGDILGAVIKYYRLYQIKDWATCNPILDNHGTFMLLDIDNTGMLIPKMHTCRVECDITLNKDTAEIILNSYRLNHYRISGSMHISGWFKNKIDIPLENTCETIDVTCGLKTMSFHACFHTHKSCIRYFKGSMLPEITIEAMCQNIELIIIGTVIFFGSIFLIILTKTYIVYLFIPIFYPVVKVYAILYNRYFKLCKKCLLAVHPFTNCSTVCICGMAYGNTESLRLHRLCKSCDGYKALPKARKLCKSKVSNIILCACSALIFFSFITPINAECFALEDLPDEFTTCKQQVEEDSKMTKLRIVLDIIIILLGCLTPFMTKILIKAIYVVCPFCGMLHKRRGLKMADGMTNYCLMCICSTDKGLTYHRASTRCYSPTKIKIIYSWLLILLITNALTIIAANDKVDCTNLKDGDIAIEKVSQCIAIHQNYTEAAKSLEDILNEYSIFDQQEKAEIKNADINCKTINKAIEGLSVLETQAFYEQVKSKMCPADVGDITKLNSASNLQWKTLARTYTLALCNEHPHKHICKCMSAFTYCTSTNTDHGGGMKKFYEHKIDNFEHDVKIVLRIIKYMVPGLGSTLLQKIEESRKYSELMHIVGKLLPKAEKNIQMKGVLQFAAQLLTYNVSIVSETPNIVAMSLIKSEGQSITGKLPGAAPLNICTNSKKVICFSPRGISQPYDYIMCEDKLYKWPQDGVYRHNKNSGEACARDTHCISTFEPATRGVERRICKSYETTYADDIYSNAISECIVTKFGTCTVKSSTWPFAVCQGVYYYTSARQHSKTHDITKYCLSSTCQERRYPFRSDYCSNTVWDSTYRTKLNMKHISHPDIENYISALQSDIANDLTTHHFRPTKNLPSIAPTYNGITIQGDKISSGIRNAFIEGKLPAIAGLASGLDVHMPDGTDLFSIIIYVKKISIKSNYQYIYSTGPTVSINVKHNEHCTGKCPESIPSDLNWLTFSREHSSSWGCEEWGCIAINEGCVFGSCQDVIRPEMKIYKRIGSETKEVEVCITTAHETFCNNVDVLQPLISQRIQLDLQSITTTNMPPIIAVKNGKIYTGDINDLGVTAKKCGSVQSTDNGVLGSGNVKFDYICHAFNRKDIIVRRCYENAYESCKFLDMREDLAMVSGTGNEVHMKISNVGTISYKIMLGDFDYDLFTEHASLNLDALKCGGCKSCPDGMHCSFKANTDKIVLCKIISNCVSFLNNIIIDPEQNDYSLKLGCSELIADIEINVCNAKLKARPTLIKQVPKISLASIDESTYIEQHDDRCSTWLCRVRDEGINAILSPIFGKLSYYWMITIYTIIAIISIMILLYVLIPFCKRIKGILEYNERVYQIENKFK
uniref:Envelopment polyprotein n=1 Tax=Orthobunyavirus shuniense TaxID=3052440 RepID=A0A2U8NG12_9VIRU|nr:M polyprotein [Orthobunyavirus shuniense]